jgi:phosphoadenosine phosphosulfate reductase
MEGDCKVVHGAAADGDEVNVHGRWLRLKSILIFVILQKKIRKEKVEQMNYNVELKGMSPEEVLAFFAERNDGRIAFSTSLGAEDQVIVHMIAGRKLPIRIFTLDTGRLFPETYDLLDITSKKYGVPIDICFPDAAEVQKMVNEKGINLFYDSIENRKLCCGIRKTAPLKKALAGMDVWISGLRRGQSVTRSELQLTEWNEEYSLLKVHPLFDWTEEMVWNYIRLHHVPYNTLHDKNYPSIGCQPCTRAILQGEDIRAGRWWWENPDTRECGLHK